MDLRPQSVLATWPLKTALVFFRNQRARCAEAADALDYGHPSLVVIWPRRAGLGLFFWPRADIAVAVERAKLGASSRHHRLASSRSALRRLFMTARAVVICRACSRSALRCSLVALRARFFMPAIV